MYARALVYVCVRARAGEWCSIKYTSVDLYHLFRSLTLQFSRGTNKQTNIVFKRQHKQTVSHPDLLSDHQSFWQIVSLNSVDTENIV